MKVRIRREACFSFARKRNAAFLSNKRRDYLEFCDYCEVSGDGWAGFGFCSSLAIRPMFLFLLCCSWCSDRLPTVKSHLGIFVFCDALAPQIVDSCFEVFHSDACLARQALVDTSLPIINPGSDAFLSENLAARRGATGLLRSTRHRRTPQMGNAWRRRVVGGCRCRKRR